MEISNILSGTIDSHAAMMQASRREDDFARFQTFFEDAMGRADNVLQSEERAQIREAAEMFESHFLNMMFRTMRMTTFDGGEDAFIPRGNAERIFTEMLDEQMSDAAAAQGGFGLADMIYAQMTMHFRD